MRCRHVDTVFPRVFNVIRPNRVDIFGNVLGLYCLENMKAFKLIVIITKALKQWTRN